MLLRAQTTMRGTTLQRVVVLFQSRTSRFQKAFRCLTKNTTTATSSLSRESFSKSFSKSRFRGKMTTTKAEAAAKSRDEDEARKPGVASNAEMRDFLERNQDVSKKITIVDARNPDFSGRTVRWTLRECKQREIPNRRLWHRETAKRNQRAIRQNEKSVERIERGGYFANVRKGQSDNHALRRRWERTKK